MKLELDIKEIANSVGISLTKKQFDYNEDNCNYFITEKLEEGCDFNHIIEWCLDMQADENLCAKLNS